MKSYRLLASKQLTFLPLLATLEAALILSFNMTLVNYVNRTQNVIFQTS